MCGIAGAFSFNSNLDAKHQAAVSRLNAWQAHRGPDGEGVWSSDDHAVILGHRRLAIIDTGLSGAQPMSDFTGRWTISFNGEIYNYRAVRRTLEELGYRFGTNSDTEVLINAVAEWGAAGLKRLRGMYAFALWDKLNKELWLARDPYGIKPLYIAQSGNILWFASQARALAECASIENKRDAAGLVGFYLWGHIPEPFTWWENIRALPPGCVQRFRVGKASTRVERFFDISRTYAKANPEGITPQDLSSALRDSVRSHLVADVPVGIFLSAGIDSNVIAGLAAELQEGVPLQTVTLAFDEFTGTANDEAPLAELSARNLGTDHVTVKISKDQFETLLDPFFEAMDQPSIDGLNTYLISRAAAAQGLKVVLSGLGGDELFGGYPSFRQVPFLASFGRVFPLAQQLREGISGTLRRLSPNLFSPKFAAAIRYSGDIGAAYLLRRSMYLVEELNALLDETWLEEGIEKLQTHDSLQRIVAPLAAAGRSQYAQVSALESCSYMRCQLLRDSDWASMAHGLELRVPFVDTALLERLAPAISSSRPPTKTDLASCVKHITGNMASRPKTGFLTPAARWIARPGTVGRHLQSWAGTVHRRFRTGQLARDFEPVLAT